MLAKKLESELKCGFCKEFLKEPRILACGHSVCEECGVARVEKVSKIHKSLVVSKSNNNISTFQTARKGDSMKSQGSTVVSLEMEQDALSESDSGIFLSHGSLGSENAFAASMSQPGATIKLPPHFLLSCPVCSSPSVLPNNSLSHLPPNTPLASIVRRYLTQNGMVPEPSPGSSSLKPGCQLCEESQVKEAVVVCEQCQVLYCLPCRDKCHPMRGPLEKHSLVTLDSSTSRVGCLQPRSLHQCVHHDDQVLDFFCQDCSTLICAHCKQSGPHFRHQTISVAIHTKNSKVSLSKCLQSISKKVISANEFIQSLNGSLVQFKVEHDEFVKDVDESFDQMIDMIEARRKYCHDQAKLELERKEKVMKEQMMEGSMKISQTMSMIQLNVEMFKETNLLDFCKVSDQILKRALRTEKTILQELNDLKPKCNKKMELKLDNDGLVSQINNLDFKSFKCPESPKFIMDRCSVWDNLITVVWHPQGSIEVDKYVLDIDDGAGGSFKTAYYGPECMCTIENLHFGANYKLRIKATNKAGVSLYGDLIRLMTSKMANFRMLPYAGAKKPGVSLSMSGMSLESSPSNSEDTVFIASTGFSKGVHYWEYKIEYYDGVGEPSFGVAMENCAKNKRLGSDIFSWGMYMNSKRSWFQHNSEHTERTDVQLCQGLRIGVRLDLDSQRLSYFINDQPHGPIAFTQLLVTSSRSYNQLMNNPSAPHSSSSTHSLNNEYSSCAPTLPPSSSSSSSSSSSRSRMLFPALSISHGIKISLLSGLSPPSDDSCSEEEEEEDPGQDQEGGDDTVEMMTPSLTKRMDVSYLLQEMTSDGSSSSFQDLVL